MTGIAVNVSFSQRFSGCEYVYAPAPKLKIIQKMAIDLPFLLSCGYDIMITLSAAQRSAALTPRIAPATMTNTAF